MLWHEISGAERCKTSRCLQGENSAARNRMDEAGCAEHGPLTQAADSFRTPRLPCRGQQRCTCVRLELKAQENHKCLALWKRVPVLLLKEDCCQKMWLCPPLLYFIAKSRYWENSSCPPPSSVPRGSGGVSSIMSGNQFAVRPRASSFVRENTGSYWSLALLSFCDLCRTVFG